MNNAILLHGLPSKKEYYDSAQPSASNAHWFPWLQKQLLVNDTKAYTPEVPFVYKMIWDDWVKEVERFELNEDTLLVGHSMGAGFWVRYLSEHPELKVAKVILVAPWLNLDHEYDTDFFDFDLNLTALQSQNIVIFNSDNDSQDVQDTVMHLQTKLPKIRTVDFHNYGHFCYRDLKTDAFPELLKEALS